MSLNHKARDTTLCLTRGIGYPVSHLCMRRLTMMTILQETKDLTVPYVSITQIILDAPRRFASAYSLLLL